MTRRLQHCVVDFVEYKFLDLEPYVGDILFEERLTFPYVVPERVMDLTIRNFLGESLEGLIVLQERQLLSLQYENCPNIKGFPSNLNGLRYLNISNTKIRSIDNVPNSVKILHAWVCPIVEVYHLPIKLELLALDNTPVRHIEYFPENLRTLWLNGCFNLRTLPKLPEDLRLLVIKHSGLMFQEIADEEKLIKTWKEYQENMVE
jgi:hypothetical protein